MVKALSNNQTAVTCVLETGRTHQIRVHLASEGHPIIGDPLYNPKSQAARLMLHASQLHLLHPFTKTNRCDCSVWYYENRRNRTVTADFFCFYFTAHSLLRTAYLRLLSVLC